MCSYILHLSQYTVDMRCDFFSHVKLVKKIKYSIFPPFGAHKKVPCNDILI